MKKYGFTLAEVLITLGIIGVVAALVMPGLIANYQKQETVTRLKRAYSFLYQAYTLSEAYNGTSDSWAYKGKTRADGIDFLDTYIFPYLKTTKICRTNNVECGFTYHESYKALNGQPAGMGNNDAENVSVMLAGGTSINFIVAVSRIYNYLIVMVDVNGPKKPNVVGKDTFRFNLFFNGERGFKPVGAGLTRNALLNTGGVCENKLTYPSSYACNKNISGVAAGQLCSALIMLDGWQIKDDYPW
ncbi:MAG: type II secretion system GspH family protein [Heliobacteriaceae bacterium]|nr:type II secretion system GspH family protein [Heliobacteriaceae bacterium]